MPPRDDQIRFSGTESASNVATGSSPAAAPIAGIHDDNFVFQKSTSDETAHNATVELIDAGHANDQAQHLPPVLTPLSPVEVLYDPAQDDGHAAASQFHQMVASVAHLH